MTSDPVTAFLTWLRVEKNFSPATIRAYPADLEQLARNCATPGADFRPGETTGETPTPVIDLEGPGSVRPPYHRHHHAVNVGGSTGSGQGQSASANSS